MLEFYNDAVHKARKEHKCEMCHRIINPGEKYHRQSGKYDGDFFDRKLHNTCNNILSAYLSEIEENEFDYSDIYDWLRESYCFGCTEKEDCKIGTLKCEKILIDFIEVENETLY